jgi:hypothetical protein
MGQDRRVVTSQRPAEARLGNGERLVASDAPIAWFRRWHARGVRGASDSDDELVTPPSSPAEVEA